MQFGMPAKLEGNTSLAYITTCIAKEENNSWSENACKSVVKENNDGSVYTDCECSVLSPTTIIADFNKVLADSNLDEVFSI